MRFIAAVITMGLFCSNVTSLAQAPQVFKADLRIIPIQSANTRALIDESASVVAKANATATLTGTKLTVTGSFEGFKTPASLAQIRTGPAMGARGPVVFDLTVTKDTKGSISGTFDLTAEQVTLLRNNRLYAQIHNANTPDGALWGWFLK
jgi:hypothetical protein